MNNTIGEIIRKRREEIGLTPTAFCKKVGIGDKTNTLNKWENGTNVPRVKTLVSIADTLQCDIDYLLGAIPEATHEITDIHNKTGLSEKAINILTGEDELIPYDTPESHNIMKQHFINSQGYILSWFIENGLLKYVKDIAFMIIDYFSFKDIQYIPEELKKPLKTAFAKAYSARLDITERQFEYMDRIAVYLINCPKEYVRKIKDLKPFIFEHDGQVYRLFEQYTFSDFDDYVEYEADKKNLTSEEREIVATTAESLSGVTFSYFQYQYELDLNKQRTVNKISALIDEYQDHIQKEREVK